MYDKLYYKFSKKSNQKIIFNEKSKFYIKYFIF